MARVPMRLLPQPLPCPHMHTGTTPVIIAAENAVGIKEGGRTGLVALTVSGCFGVALFLAPFLQSIPQVGGVGVLA
jgi:AGZA family xanthine/uracil permease-like MFS transporter